MSQHLTSSGTEVDGRGNKLPGRLGALPPRATHASGSSTAAFYLPRPNIIVTQVVGSIDRLTADALIAFGDQQIAVDGPRRIDYFHDWEGVTTYDSGARLALTRWTLEHYQLVGKVIVLTPSKLVAMGVATANLATASVLSIVMRTYKTRTEFDRDLLAAVEGR